MKKILLLALVLLSANWLFAQEPLKVGDKARFVIPSHLGYGSRGAGGVIPPDATLIFDVELMNVK